MQQKTKLQDNQQGLVSIVVTMIIMIVLTLVVTGFAQLARREQRETLDRQLSTQAFYAAESGINDGRRLLKTPAYIAGANKDTCTSPGSNLETTSNVQYTCLLIKQDLPDLKFQNVVTNKSTVVPIDPVATSGNSFDSLSISWQKKDGVSSVGTTAFPARSTSWGANDVSVLRIDLVPFGSADTADSLQRNAFTAFLNPTTSGGTVGYTNVPSEQGQIVSARCVSGGSRLCTVKITAIPAGKYFLRMKSVYNNSDVVICANNCDGNITLKGAQAEIDSTGRANDVLKRVQARVSTVPNYNGSVSTPEYALDSINSLCKTYAVWPAGGDQGVCTP